MDPQYEQLLTKLQSLKGDALVSAETRALKAVGNLIEITMQGNAPVASTETTGTALAPGELRDSIRAKVHVADPGKRLDDGSRVTVGPGKKTAHVARFIENGHAARSSASKPGAAKFVPANPFVRRTADATQDKAAQAYGEIMAEEIQKVIE